MQQQKKTMPQHKPGFTFMEILVAISILALSLSAIVVMLQNSGQQIQKVKNTMIVNNLSKEGVEIIRNIRDTNWTKRSNQKDACRLKTDPFKDIDGEVSDSCEDHPRIQSGRYTIITQEHAGQIYFALSGITDPNIQDDIIQYEIYRDLCDESTTRPLCDHIDPQTQIMRLVHVQGLFQKDTAQTGGQYISCPNSLSEGCTGIPTELSFCVHTQITTIQTQKNTLCSSITNFQE